MRQLVALVFLVACDHGAANAPTPDAPLSGDVSDAPAAVASRLGIVDMVTPMPACPAGAPPGSTCESIRVTSCPGIEATEATATIAILAAASGTTARGTITHMKGGGGEGYELVGVADYQAQGFQQVFVAWNTDWELTPASGIKTAACRPATVLHWIFTGIHGADRTLGFCGQGHSGGSGELGYALSHYGLGDDVDYVNELSGPPFARLDLGCNYAAPPTATVCGDTVTMRLPTEVNAWENTTLCGSTSVPDAELARWRDDSIAIGGVYDFPNTRVEMFDCTNNATAVTAMAQLYQQQITSSSEYHCYTAADGCQGEGLGPTGTAAATSAMISGCVPRHPNQ